MSVGLFPGSCVSHIAGISTLLRWIFVDRQASQVGIVPDAAREVLVQMKLEGFGGFEATSHSSQG